MSLLDDLNDLPIQAIVVESWADGPGTAWAKYGERDWYEPGIAEPRTTSRLALGAHTAGHQVRVVWRPDGLPLWP